MKVKADEHPVTRMIVIGRRTNNGRARFRAHCLNCGWKSNRYFTKRSAVRNGENHCCECERRRAR